MRLNRMETRHHEFILKLISTSGKGDNIYETKVQHLPLFFLLSNSSFNVAPSC